jgi:hypothetical protein
VLPRKRRAPIATSRAQKFPFGVGERRGILCGSRAAAEAPISLMEHRVVLYVPMRSWGFHPGDHGCPLGAQDPPGCPLRKHGTQGRSLAAQFSQGNPCNPRQTVGTLTCAANAPASQVPHGFQGLPLGAQEHSGFR